MKRTHAKAFPPIDRLQGRGTLELLIAAGMTDVIIEHVLHQEEILGRELYALMRTCKALRDTVHIYLSRMTRFILPYVIAETFPGRVLEMGHIYIVLAESGPSSILPDIMKYLKTLSLPSTRLLKLGLPYKLDPCSGASRSLWNDPGAPPLPPLEMMQALKKERKKRQFLAFAREAGLLPPEQNDMK